MRAVLATVLTMVVCGDVWANSYSLVPIMKKDLPSGVAAIAQWKSGLSDFDEKQSEVRMDVATLEHFLDHGRWQIDFPLYAAEKELKEKFRARTEGGFDNDPEWKAEQELHQRQIEKLRERYRSSAFGSRIEGAFRSANGRHFRWNLSSPVLLQLEFGEGGRCYLELSDEEAVDLTKLSVAKKDLAEATEGKIAIPDLVEGEWKMSPDSLPATGRHRRLPQSLVEDFCRRGKVVEGAWPVTKSKCRFVTTLWFPEFKKLLEKYPPVPRDDGLGNFVIGGYGLGGGGSFAVIFEDAKKQLWRARLLSDACLLLEDSQGRRIFLQHPAALKEGSGQTVAEKKGR